MNHRIISVSKEYSETPAGRFKKDGPKSGEEFRDKFLIPNLKNFKHIIVELDGVLGYGSSFLEEAFGGLIRKGFTKDQIKKFIEIRSSYPIYLDRIWTYIEDAENKKPLK